MIWLLYSSLPSPSGRASISSPQPRAGAWACLSCVKWLRWKCCVNGMGGRSQGHPDRLLMILTGDRLHRYPHEYGQVHYVRHYLVTVFSGLPPTASPALICWGSAKGALQSSEAIDHPKKNKTGLAPFIFTTWCASCWSAAGRESCLTSSECRLVYTCAVHELVGLNICLLQCCSPWIDFGVPIKLPKSTATSPESGILQSNLLNCRFLLWRSRVSRLQLFTKGFAVFHSKL